MSNCPECGYNSNRNENVEDIQGLRCRVEPASGSRSMQARRMDIEALGFRVQRFGSRVNTMQIMFHRLECDYNFHRKDNMKEIHGLGFRLNRRQARARCRRGEWGWRR